MPTDSFSASLPGTPKRHRRVKTPKAPNLFRAPYAEYPHRPVQAGGNGRTVKHDVICARCLTIWPCAAQLMDERAAAADLETHWRDSGYAHASTLAATA